MNRIVEGTGVTPYLDSQDDTDPAALPRLESYVALGKSLGVV